MIVDTKIEVALVTAGVALLGTITVAILNYLSARKQDHFKSKTDAKLANLNFELQSKRDQRLAEAEAEKVLSKFRDPLLHAAYDLQSRIYNIVELVFLLRYFTKGSKRERTYAVENTVFLVAQFLGWTELIRQEIQFLDLGNDEETSRFRQLQDRLYTQFQTDDYGRGFCLFAGEQRALGELMVLRLGTDARCMGFAAFSADRNPSLDYWLDPLRADVKQMAKDLEPFRPRLVTIQHSLIDLMEFLDPKYIYFPEESRTKIDRADGELM
ncbi:MAG TPA: hypothetical protein VK581_01525 [Chthoniobacterales bacterium]|nr:hypothetical protein [Chthoniobacterales bacterium]